MSDVNVDKANLLFPKAEGVLDGALMGELLETVELDPSTDETGAVLEDPDGTLDDAVGAEDEPCELVLATVDEADCVD